MKFVRNYLVFSLLFTTHLSASLTENINDILETTSNYKFTFAHKLQHEAQTVMGDIIYLNFPAPYYDYMTDTPSDIIFSATFEQSHELWTDELYLRIKALRHSDFNQLNQDVIIQNIYGIQTSARILGLEDIRQLAQNAVEHLNTITNKKSTVANK